MDLDTGAFVFRVLIGLVLIAGIIKVFVKQYRRKKARKIINVTSRGRGHVDKDGNVHLDSIDSYDVVEKPARKR